MERRMNLLSHQIFAAKDTANHRSTKRISITRNHNRCAGTADFWEISRGGHFEVELRTLAANDRTVDVGFVQCALQLAASRAAAMTGLAKLARLAGRRQHGGGN